MPGGIPIPPIPILAPIGTIVEWQKDNSHTPVLPDGWVECRGQIINDPASPYNGTGIPNLCPDYVVAGTVDALNYFGEYYRSYAYGNTHNDQPYYYRKVYGNTDHGCIFHISGGYWTLDESLAANTNYDYQQNSTGIVGNYHGVDGASGDLSVAVGSLCRIMRIK